MIRVLAILLGFLAALGCARSDGPAPVVLRLEPNEGGPGPTRVAVIGVGFTPRVRADLDRPSESTADVNFEVRLENDEIAYLLGQVVLVDSKTLSAIVPGGLPAGAYDLTLEDPRGREVMLRKAFTVKGAACPGLSAPHCLIAGECVAAFAQNPANACERCDPAVSTAGWSPVPDGARCDDGDECTRGEVCRSSKCGNPTSVETCTGECLGGTCDKATGQCTVVAADGTACDLGNGCEKGKTCQAGGCGRPTKVTLCPQASCAKSVCSPATGLCVTAFDPDAARCDDHNLCSDDDECHAGVCRGTPGCANTAPVACLTVAPAAAVVGAAVAFDATCSADLEDPASALVARFDFGDGTFDASFGPLTAAHAYQDGGVYEAVVEVRDLGGLSMFARRLVSVAGGAQDVLVTTAADEADPGATPLAPGGAGFSLREAIAYVNDGGTPKRVRFDGPMTIALGSVLPPVEVSGAVVAGGSGVSLDFSQAAGSAACLVANGAGQWFIGLAAGGCGGQLVQLNGAGDHVSECRLGLGSRNVTGVLASGSGAEVGPRNRLSGFSGEAVTVRGANARVYENQLRDSFIGVAVHSGGGSARVEQNEISGCVRQGIYATGAAPGPRVLNNTVVASGSSGVEFVSPLGPATVQNNLIHGSVRYGVRAPASLTVAEGSNLYFGNLSGAVSTGTLGAGSIVADPRFIGPEVGDFRLAPQSPAVNAGLDAGLDLNGPRPGLFDGTAPDLGAWESPY